MADICTNFTVPIDLNPKFDIIWSFDYCILGEIDSSAALTTFLYKKGGDLNQGAPYSSLGYASDSINQGLTGGYVCIALDSDDVFSKPLNRPPYQPIIKVQPKSGTAPLNLTIVAKGTSPLTYQWYRNGEIIVGAINSSFLATVDGMYRVRISNSVGSVYSDEVYVVQKPIIIKQPTGGDYPITLSASLSGTPPFTYQWYKNDIEINEDGNDETLYTSEEGKYKVKITNFAGDVFSNNIIVTIPIIPPTIIIHPTDGYPNKTLTVSATGTEPFIYEWFKNDELIFNQTTSSYLAENEGTYKVKVSNISGFQYSNNAIISPAPKPPSIILQPVGGKAPINLTVDAIGSEPLTYKWIKNNSQIVGTDKTYNTENSGIFKVVISNFVGSITSNSVEVTNLPVIITHPESGNLPTELYVAATSNLALTYQWYKDGSEINGATGNKYVPLTKGSYKVAVTNASGTVYSDIAIISGEIFINIVSFTGPEYFDESLTVNPSANTYIIEFDRLVKLKENNFKEAFSKSNINVKNIIPLDASGGLAKKYKIETLILNKDIPSYNILKVEDAEMTPVTNFKNSIKGNTKLNDINDITIKSFKINSIPAATTPNIYSLFIGTNSLINLGNCTASIHYSHSYVQGHSIIFINTTKQNSMINLYDDINDPNKFVVRWEGAFQYDVTNKNNIDMIWECTVFKEYPNRFEIKTHPEKWVNKKIDDIYPLNQIRKHGSRDAYLKFNFEAGKAYTIDYCYSVQIPADICEDNNGSRNVAYPEAAISLVK